MDWEAKFRSNHFKVYYRQVSIFTSELVKLRSFMDRFEREGEHMVFVIPNIGVTETGPLLTRASGVNSPVVMACKS